MNYQLFLPRNSTKMMHYLFQLLWGYVSFALLFLKFLVQNFIFPVLSLAYYWLFEIISTYFCSLTPFLITLSVIVVFIWITITRRQQSMREKLHVSSSKPFPTNEQEYETQLRTSEELAMWFSQQLTINNANSPIAEESRRQGRWWACYRELYSHPQHNIWQTFSFPSSFLFPFWWRWALGWGCFSTMKVSEGNVEK